MNISLKFILAATLAFALPQLVLAGDKQKAGSNVCKATMEKVCKGLSGKDRSSCFQAHKSEFTPECQQKLASRLSSTDSSSKKGDKQGKHKKKKESA